MNNRLLIGISFSKNNPVILSPFYARYNANPQPQSKTPKKTLSS
jgi:hypothetical protein